MNLWSMYNFLKNSSLYLFINLSFFSTEVSSIEVSIPERYGHVETLLLLCLDLFFVLKLFLIQKER